KRLCNKLSETLDLPVYDIRRINDEA
mgnify:CR=1